MLIVIDKAKMVESSVVPPGPRSVTEVIDKVTETDLITLNNNNNNNNRHLQDQNESDNEKEQVEVENKVNLNGGTHLIQKEEQEIVQRNGNLDEAEDKVSDKDQITENKDDEEDEEDYQDVEEEEDFESLDEEEDNSSEDENQGQFTPETGTCTVRKRGVGVIPDVLLNELHQILVSSSQDQEDGGEIQSDDADDDEGEDENGESWSSSSDSEEEGLPEALEAIPEEEEEDWDSDSTLTELSSGGGGCSEPRSGSGAHARIPPLSDVSTQNPEPPPTIGFQHEDGVHHPCPSLLPGPETEHRVEFDSTTADFLHSSDSENIKGPPFGDKVQQHLTSSPPSTKDTLIVATATTKGSGGRKSPPQLSPEETETASPTSTPPTTSSKLQVQCSSGDSGNESGSPTEGVPFKKKKSVTFSLDKDEVEEEGNSLQGEEGAALEEDSQGGSKESGESLEEKEITDDDKGIGQESPDSLPNLKEVVKSSPTEKEEVNWSKVEEEQITKSIETQTNGPSDQLLDKTRPLLFSNNSFREEKVPRVRYESAVSALQKSSPTRKSVTFKDLTPSAVVSNNSPKPKSVRTAGAGESVTGSEEKGGSESGRPVGESQPPPEQWSPSPHRGLAPVALGGAPPTSEYFVVKYLAAEQQRQLDLVDLTRFTSFEGGRELSKFIEASTAGSYFSDNNTSTDPIDLGEMHQRLSTSCSEHQHLPPGPPREKPRSVLRKTGASVKRSGRNVSFNESLNLFYEAECQCWIPEDDYARLRHEEQMQQQLYEQATQLHQLHHHHQHHNHHNHAPYLTYDPPPLEFEDTPTLSPPEGYKDRFFPQMQMDPHQQHHHHQHQLQLQQQNSLDPDVTRVSPPSPPAARRKVFLKENSTEGQGQGPANHTHHRPILNGLEEDEDEEGRAKKSSRFGGILRRGGRGRLWRSNSTEAGGSGSGQGQGGSSDEPDLLRDTERNGDQDGDGGWGDPDENYSIPTNYVSQQNQSQQVEMDPEHEVLVGHRPTQVSIGTAPLRTSEQIRLAVDSTLRISRSKNKAKQECSSLVEKLRWLTSLDDEDSDSQSGFATWPSRDKNGLPNNTPPAPNSSSSSSRKSDAGTSTSEEFVHPNHALRHPISSNEAKIKQISYTLEDIDEGLKGGESELESFITEDGGRIERIRRRYGEDVGGDDYGFSRRPSVKGIKPKFSSTNQIFAQFTRAGAETPIPQMTLQMESQYENTRVPVVSQQNSHYDPLPPSSTGDGGSGGARVNLNYDQFPPNPPPTSSSSGSSVSGSGNGNNGASQPQPSVRPGIGSNEESRSHFEMIRQSFEQASFVNYNRPHSWSVSTLPHNNNHTGQGQVQPHPASTGHIPLPGMANNLSGSALNIQGQGQNQGQNQVVGPQGQPQQPQNNLSMGMQQGMAMMNGGGPGPGGSRPNSMPMMGGPGGQYGTLPSQSQHQQNMMMMAQQQQQQQQQGPGGQPIYGTVRRVPNVIGRPLFLHYGALSVEAHPNKLVQPYPPTKVPETPSPTQPQPQQQAPAPINNIKYYGPPIRYYQNPPPPVPPRSATTTIGGNGVGGPPPDCIGLERGNPEGATDEEVSLKEPYSMNV